MNLQEMTECFPRPPVGTLYPPYYANSSLPDKLAIAGCVAADRCAIALDSGARGDMSQLDFRFAVFDLGQF
jgi:hypothetical protein